MSIASEEHPNAADWRNRAERAEAYAKELEERLEEREIDDGEELMFGMALDAKENGPINIYFTWDSPEGRHCTNITAVYIGIQPGVLPGLPRSVLN